MRGRKMGGRNLSFKPLFRRFGPLDRAPKEPVTLRHDELEAIYLADHQGLYQDACAEQMGISRTTFSRTIKSARAKLATLLLFGRTLSIESEEHPYLLTFPSNDRTHIAENPILATHFVIAEIQQGAITSMRFLENPVVENLRRHPIDLPADHDGRGLGAGRLIPEILKGVSIGVFREIGDGLRRNLEGLGMGVHLTDRHTIDEVLKEL